MAATASATTTDINAEASRVDAEDDHDISTSTIIPVSIREQKTEEDTSEGERTSYGATDDGIIQDGTPRQTIVPERASYGATDGLLGGAPRGGTPRQTRARDEMTCWQVCCTKESAVTVAAGMFICICLISECVLFTARMVPVFHPDKKIPDAKVNRFGNEYEKREALVQSGFNGATFLGVASAFLVAKPLLPAHNVHVTVTVLILLLVLDFMTAFSSERNSYWFLQLGIDASLYVSLILYFNFVDVPDNRCRKCCCSLHDVLLWINAGLVVVFMIFVFSINTIIEQHEIGELTGTINGANLLRYLVGITEGLLLFEVLHDALQRVKQICLKRHSVKCFKNRRKKSLTGLPSGLLNLAVLSFFAFDMVVFAINRLQMSYQDGFWTGNTSAHVRVNNTIATNNQRLFQESAIGYSSVLLLVVIMFMSVPQSCCCNTNEEEAEQRDMPGENEEQKEAMQNLVDTVAKEVVPKLKENFELFEKVKVRCEEAHKDYKGTHARGDLSTRADTDYRAKLLPLLTTVEGVDLSLLEENTRQVDTYSKYHGTKQDLLSVLCNCCDIGPVMCAVLIFLLGIAMLLTSFLSHFKDDHGAEIPAPTTYIFFIGYCSFSHVFKYSALVLYYTMFEFHAPEDEDGMCSNIGYGLRQMISAIVVLWALLIFVTNSYLTQIGNRNEFLWPLFLATVFENILVFELVHMDFHSRHKH